MEKRSGEEPAWARPDLLKRVLRDLEQPEFNQFIATLWQHHGWETTVDYGSADVLAKAPENENVQYALHTPEYRTRQQISGDKVVQCAELHRNSEVVTPVIVTTGDFAREAEERAKTAGVNLVDGDDLINKIEWANAYETVCDYAPVLRETASIPEMEALLNQRDRTGSPEEALTEANEASDSVSRLTSFPGIRAEQHWARHLVSFIMFFVALVSIYSFIPAESSVVARLARVGIYFATIGSVAGIVISFYMDISSIRRAETYWNPSPVLYGVLVSFTFGLAWLFYFYKRQYHFGKATARPPQETE